MTHSKRRSTVNGRMTEPYSDSEYGPRSVSATLHTKLDRADTIEIPPDRRDKTVSCLNPNCGVRHNAGAAHRWARHGLHSPTRPRCSARLHPWADSFSAAFEAPPPPTSAASSHLRAAPSDLGRARTWLGLLQDPASTPQIQRQSAEEPDIGFDL